MPVIDSHFHWFPRPYLERMCEREGYPRAVRDGSGYVYLYNDGKEQMALPEIWFDLDAGLEAAQVAGATTAVVCTAGVLAGLLDQVPVAEAVDIALEYNAIMAETEAALPGRFYGTATVPMHDEHAAIEVLDNAVKELGLHAVNLQPVTNGEAIDATRLRPYFARVEELGVPLVIHPTDLVWADALRDYDGALQLTIGRLLDSSITVLRLIFSGTLERHPDLKVIQTHGGGLLPYQAGRLDKNAKIPGLGDKPSAFLQRLFVDTVCPQALTIETAVRFFGAHQVLYGTDYPCWNPQAALDTIAEAQLTEVEHQLITSANVGSLLRL